MGGRRRSRIGWGVVTAGSVLLVAFAVLHVLFDHSEYLGVVDAVAAWVSATALCAAFTGVTAWARGRESETPRGWAVCRWFLSGCVVLGASGAGTFVVEALKGAALVEPVFTTELWVLGGGTVGLFVGYLDARRLDAHERAVEANANAERLAQRLSVINRVLRHDVRTDLNVVLGYADVLGERFESEPDELARIRERGRRLVDVATRARTVEELLADSETQPMRVGATLAERLDALRAAHPDVTIEADVEADATADAHPLLTVALDVVLDTAVGANADGSASRVTVACRTVDGVVEVVVEDDGPGVPDGQNAVLEGGGEGPLEHAEGIDLWTVRWAVEESEGEFAFDRSTPSGNRFVVQVPATEE